MVPTILTRQPPSTNFTDAQQAAVDHLRKLLILRRLRAEIDLVRGHRRRPKFCLSTAVLEYQRWHLVAGVRS